ncbi:MAG: ABC transporter permease subunit [Infirmifilum sp.]
MSERILVITRKELSENFKSMRYWGLIGLFILLFTAMSAAIGSAIRGLRIPGMEFGGGRFVVQLATSISNSMLYMAPLLGIALGFAAIAAEREKGTLRLVLARPIYRDQVLNGKILAAFILIFFAIFTSTVIALPISIALHGLTVTTDDLVRLFISMTPSTLLALAYYALALFVSVLSDRSSRAFLYALIAWIFFTFILPIIASLIALSILGPPPAVSFNFSAAGNRSAIPPQLLQYEQKSSQITSSVLLISPNSRYTSFMNALFSRARQGTNTYYTNLLTVFATRWIDLTVLIAYVVVFIALSYIFFVRRQEVR